MNVMGLCSGIGGLELGVKIAEPRARVVCYVEGEAYAVSTLIARMGVESLDEAPIWSELRTFNGEPWRGKVDCIIAGFGRSPSVWGSIKRVIGEVRPGRCFLDSDSSDLSDGFKIITGDLCRLGYGIAAGLFTAREIGAPHERERLFIMADAGMRGCFGGPFETKRFGDAMDFPFLPDDPRWVLPESIPKPVVFGTPDWIADRLDRIRACGNATVPLVAAYAWKVLGAL